MKWREKLILLALLVAMVAIAYLAFNSGPKEAPTSRVTSPAPGQAAAPFPATEQAAAPSPAPAAQAGNQIMPVIIGQSLRGVVAEQSAANAKLIVCLDNNTKVLEECRDELRSVRMERKQV